MYLFNRRHHHKSAHTIHCLEDPALVHLRTFPVLDRPLREAPLPSLSDKKIDNSRRSALDAVNQSPETAPSDTNAQTREGPLPFVDIAAT